MSEATFGGETFDAVIDGPRLKGQLERVRQFMSDGRWHDLEEIARSTSTSMLSVSARVRDLRKPQFGGYVLEVKRVGNSGLWFYRVTGREQPQAAPVMEAKVEPVVEPAPAPVAAVTVVERKPVKRVRGQRWARRTFQTLMGDLFERLEQDRAAITEAAISTAARHMLESRS